MRTCNGPGDCGRPHHGNGLCATHVKQQSRGHALTVLPPWVPRACEGPCDRPASDGRYCRTHARQKQAGRELTPVKEYARRDPSGCPGPGSGDDNRCGRTIRSRGLCAQHGRQRDAGKELAPIAVPVFRACGLEHCDRKHFGHGLCDMHLRRLRAGKPMEPEPRPTECRLCGEKVHGNGLCINHYHAEWRAQRKADGKPVSAPKPRKAKAAKPASNLPPNWFKPSLRPERPPVNKNEDINVILLNNAPTVDPALVAAFAERMQASGQSVRWTPEWDEWTLTLPTRQVAQRTGLPRSTIRGRKARLLEMSAA